MGRERGWNHFCASSFMPAALTLLLSRKHNLEAGKGNGKSKHDEFK
jgi:hypothetical protein